jgi:glutathione S-transferase
MRTFSATPDEQVLQFLRRRLDDFFRIMQQHFSKQPFAAGDRATVADLSMIGYLLFPVDESGVDFTKSHPAIQAWLDRVRALPGWVGPYDLLPGKRLQRFA